MSFNQKLMIKIYRVFISQMNWYDTWKLVKGRLVSTFKEYEEISFSRSILNLPPKFPGNHNLTYLVY